MGGNILTANSLVGLFYKDTFVYVVPVWKNWCDWSIHIFKTIFVITEWVIDILYVLVVNTIYCFIHLLFIIIF